jgi:hypothetical protein
MMRVAVLSHQPDHAFKPVFDSGDTLTGRC